MSDARKQVLKKHLIALALYRGEDDEALKDAYREITDPADRRILLAVAIGARVFAEAHYYSRHSALTDEDSTAEGAKAQIREAHERRELVASNITDALGHTIQHCVEALSTSSLENAILAGTAIDAAADVVASMAAILELFDEQRDKGLSSARIKTSRI